MKKRSICIVSFILLIMLFLFLSCRGETDVTAIFAQWGLSDKELFKINNETCSLSEAMIFLTTARNEYEQSFGTGIWEKEIDGVNMESYVKENMLSQLSQIKCMVLLAAEKGIVITEEENADINQLAVRYYGELTEEEKDYMDVGQDDIVNLYRDYFLANKLYQFLTKDVDMEISEDEARVIVVDEMFFETDMSNEAEKAENLQSAQAACDRLDQGEDFSAVAASVNAVLEMERTRSREDMDENYTEMVFSLATGQVSGVVSSENGYYIVRCVNDYDQEATAVHKLEMEKERKEDAFHQEYDSFVEGLDSKFNEQVWEKISFQGSESENIETTSFFRLYQEYFGSSEI